jgi:hypothetical protein
MAHAPLDLGPTRADPLGPADYAALARAGSALRPVRRGERVAGASGLITLLAGLISLPFVLGSGVGLALAVSLAVVGWREMFLRKGLRSLEPMACGRLARNQLLLGASLGLYAIVQLVRGPANLGDITGGQLDQVPELAASADGIMRLVHLGVYGGLVVGAIVVQGSQALYYKRVGKKLRRAYAEHPIWVMRVHAAAWGGAMPARAAAGFSQPEPDSADPGGDNVPTRAAA